MAAARQLGGGGGRGRVVHNRYQQSVLLIPIAEEDCPRRWRAQTAIVLTNGRAVSPTTYWVALTPRRVGWGGAPAPREQRHYSLHPDPFPLGWVVRCFIEATLENTCLHAPRARASMCALPSPNPLFQRGGGTSTYKI
jgi:hypothetical protein